MEKQNKKLKKLSLNPSFKDEGKHPLNRELNTKKYQMEALKELRIDEIAKALGFKKRKDINQIYYEQKEVGYISEKEMKSLVSKLVKIISKWK